MDPLCLTQDHTVLDVIKIKTDFGYNSIPITKNGKSGSELVGLVTFRDVEFFGPETSLKEVMSKDPIFAEKDISLEEA